MVRPKFVCPHTCGCNYSAHQPRDVTRHIPVFSKHRYCTQSCPHYWDLSRPDIQVETPESFATRQKVKKPNEKAGLVVEVPWARIICILDPSRRAGSFKDTTYDVSWITAAELLPEDVKKVLGCNELKGYVFPVKGRKDAVRIYDWVSATVEPCRKCPSAHVLE
jgi:hypothetical protein